MRPEALILALFLAAGAAGAAGAADVAAKPAPQRMLGEVEARAYRAVGRFNVASGRHCTATLIAERLALTAAHCLYDPRTGRRAPLGAMRFVAGQRRDDYAALRKVGAVAVLPGYVYGREVSLADVRLDLALLALDAPVPRDAAAPMPLAGWNGAEPVAIVAYGRDRAYAASIREGCGVVGGDGEIALLDCAITFGVSGAPVVVAGSGGPKVVAVVSAMSDAAAAPGALVYVVLPGDRLRDLRRALRE